jgi:hypothetical protein
MARITLRLSGPQAQKLAELATAAGIDRSAMMRRLIETADGNGQGDTGGASRNAGALAVAARPSRDELIALLSEKARSGSGPAIRQLLELQRQEEGQAAVDRMNALTRG